MLYPKIETLFSRDEKGKVTGEIRKPEFTTVKRWYITEKIDGMNIRVEYELDKTGFPGTTLGWRVRFYGKTDNAQIPVPLMKHLRETFEDTPKMVRIVDYFMRTDDSVDKIVLFGEGYGAGIQSGHGYSSKQKFICFDIWINGWWLEKEHARAICKEIGIDFVPKLNITTLSEAIRFVKSKPISLIAEDIRPMEGVVATSVPTLLFRNGNPLSWKLKQKDFPTE